MSVDGLHTRDSLARDGARHALVERELREHSSGQRVAERVFTDDHAGFGLKQQEQEVLRQRWLASPLPFGGRNHAPGDKAALVLLAHGLFSPIDSSAPVAPARASSHMLAMSERVRWRRWMLATSSASS